MKRALLMFTVALALAACAELPPGDYALVPLDGQPVTPGAYRYDSPQGRYQVEVRSSGDATMAPTATTTPTVAPETPEVTVTPSPSRTPVLTPSVTPSATLTATPSPTDFSTPTPEGPTASPGPPPTVTIEPKPNLCEGVVVNQAGLNVRANHSTSAAVVGSLSADAVATIDRFYIVRDGREEWAHIVAPVQGWVAAIFYDGRRMLAWPEDVNDERAVWCLPPYVTVEWATNPPPTPPISLNTAIGVRTVPGAVGFEAMYPLMAERGIPYGVSPYASLNYCTSALDQGGICIFRPGWPDCPDGVGVVNAQESARAFMRHAEHAANQLKERENVWIEPINECTAGEMPDQLLAWWATWMSAYIDEAAARGWPPLALPGLPPGHGDERMFYIWRPVLIKLRERNGLFSMHDYTFNSRTGLCVYDEWEAARHVRNHTLMVRLGYEIPITITEAARGDGNSPVDVEDFVCWLEKVGVEEYVHSAWLWLGGKNPSWPLANLDGHYEAIAERLKRRVSGSSVSALVGYRVSKSR